MQCWSLAASVRLSDVARWCISNHGVDRLLVSTRFDRGATKRTLLVPEVSDSVERIFAGRIVTSVLATAWPGTELVDHCGLVYVIVFDEDLGKRMASVEDLICNWTQSHDPPLPEDLCLFRQAAKLPVVVSVTHEGEAWVLTDEAVTLPGAERAFLPPGELLIPRGDFFVTCLVQKGCLPNE